MHQTPTICKFWLCTTIPLETNPFSQVFYQSDPVSFASKVFFDLVAEDKIPLHLILCLDDEYRWDSSVPKPSGSR